MPVTPEPVERKLAAILSADVVGYSRLMAENEEDAVQTLKDCQLRIEAQVTRHRGRVFGGAGDAVVAEFSSAVEALRCAVEIQQGLAESNAELPEDRRMLFRIGVNLGDVLVDGDNLLGDGVNVAARLQGLAEPGGICISGTIHDQVRRKVDIGCEDLGEQSVKNIPDPVRVFRVLLPVGREGTERDEAAASKGERPPPGFAGRPAIAVLPFENLSGDPEQEYFVDGLCEDLITLLSLDKFLPVIARNSSFVYKGRHVGVKEAGRELRADYVVEGSARRSAQRLRVSAQLINATTGHHLWAERYDRELQDLFAIQDEIAEQIAASIRQQLSYAEPRRVLRLNRPSLDAWEVAQRAWWHANQRTRGDTRRAQALFRNAIELDPDFVWAYYGLVYSLALDVFYQWADDPRRIGIELLQVSQACTRLDANDPHAQLALSIGYAISGRLGPAIEAAERAVQLSPSLAFGHYLVGFHRSVGGDPKQALEAIRRAMWLSPRDPIMWVYLGAEASSHFALEDYEAVIETCQRLFQLRPEWPNAYAMMAASCVYLGRMEEARRYLRELLRVQPDFTGPRFRASFGGAKPEIIGRFIEGLVAAGLPRERA